MIFNSNFIKICLCSSFLINAKAKQEITDINQAAISMQLSLNQSMNVAQLATCTEPAQFLLDNIFGKNILHEVYEYQNHIDKQMQVAAERAKKAGTPYNASMDKLAWQSYCTTKMLLNWYATTPVARVVFSVLLSSHIDHLLYNFNKNMPDPRNLQDVTEFNILLAGLHTLKDTLIPSFTSDNEDKSSALFTTAGSVAISIGRTALGI